MTPVNHSSAIQAVLFDVDGVVIPSTTLFSERLTKQYELDPDVVREFFADSFYLCITGQADLQRKLMPKLQEWNVPLSWEEVLEFWFDDDSAVDPAMLELVTELRSSGVRCYVATNQEAHRAEYMKEALGFSTLFDGVYASCHLGAAKPEAAFFERLLNSIQCRPEQVLFIDDSSKNVAQAQRMGIEALHYTDQMSAEDIRSFVTEHQS